MVNNSIVMLSQIWRIWNFFSYMLEKGNCFCHLYACCFCLHPPLGKLIKGIEHSTSICQSSWFAAEHYWLVQWNRQSDVWCIHNREMKSGNWDYRKKLSRKRYMMACTMSQTSYFTLWGSKTPPTLWQGLSQLLIWKCEPMCQLLFTCALHRNTPSGLPAGEVGAQCG